MKILNALERLALDELALQVAEAGGEAVLRGSMHRLRRAGFVRFRGRGVYRLTPAGLSAVHRARRCLRLMRDPA